MIDFDLTSVRYPVGEHSFKKLRQKNCLYVDKTMYIKPLINQGAFLFLSRPRRFGKSLLLSTLECYFRGEKELFEGTWIGERETEWTTYPVLHFDMSRTSGNSAQAMKSYINGRLEDYEKEYGVVPDRPILDIGERYSKLIESISKATNSQVVILVDEYDNGILETLDKPKEEKEAMSDVLRAFYKQPKAMTNCVKFCMVAGVARFGSYTLFSGGNNYLDISMNDRYAAVCGITQQELLDNFQAGITSLSAVLGWTREKAISALKLKYDSYRFTDTTETVYNPFSLLWAFTENKLANYWIKSGVSKVFVKYLSSSEFDLLELQNLWVTRDRMEAQYSNEDSIPLLFQTGYLTIKDCTIDDGGEAYYRLGIPNGEVRSALVNELMPRYMGLSDNVFTQRYRQLKSQIANGDVPGWITTLKGMIAEIPFRLFNPGKQGTEQDRKASALRVEQTYHIMVHIIFQMLSIDCQSEMAVSGGSIDMVVKTDRYIYVIEFKLGGRPAKALAQIDEKGYAIPWEADGRHLYKIGLVFSSKTRTISQFDYTPKQ